MKFRFAIPRKLLLGVAGAIILLGAGAGGAAYLGYLSLPWSDGPDLRGSVDAPPPEGEAGSQPNEHSGESQDSSHVEGGESSLTSNQAQSSEEGANGHAASDGHGEENGDATQAHGEAEGGGHEAESDGHGEDAGGHAESGGHGEAAKLEGPPVVYEIPARGAFVKAVRDLMSAQSAAAVGRTSPEGSQREAILKIQLELQRFDPAKATHQELEALGIYLLSGGNPRGLSGVIDQIPASTHMTKVLRGAHDYVVGEPAKAKELLMDLDLNQYSQAFSARVSLAQSALIDPADYPAQVAALKRAAGFAPGTLVEEAALRRLVALNLKSENPGAFKRYARKYMRRFPRSLYISEFLQNYGHGILAFEAAGKPVPREDINKLLSILTDEVKRKFLLEIGKQASKRGLKDLCLYVTEDEHAQVMVAQADQNRQKLYALACQVVENAAESRDGLLAIPPQDLQPDDAALRHDALRLADAMLGRNTGPGSPQPLGPQPADPDTQSLLVSAAQQLQVSKELLEEALQ